MAITINGSGTITGISTGGLPDGIVDDGTLATSAVTSTKIADGTITNADINASAAIAGSKVDGSFGKVLQVVSATSNTSTSANTAWTDIAGLSVTIQPSATTSKIMLMYNAGGMTSPSGTQEVSFRINSSEDGNLMEIYRYIYNNDNSNYNPLPVFILYTDSPASTSSITYKVQGKCGLNSFEINSSSSNSTKSVNVVAMEIGA